MRAHPWVGALALLVLLTAATACSSGEEPSDADPSPTAAPTPAPAPTGLRWGIVLPPESSVDPYGQAEYREAVRVVRLAHQEVEEARVLVPDAAVFRADLLALLAADGHDLVCAAGPGSGPDVVRVAGDFPATRFCVIDDRLNGIPSNVVVVDLRVEEGAYLAGAAAARLASPDRPIAFLGVSAGPEADRQRAAFVAGARRVSGDISVLVQFTVVEGDGEDAQEAAREVTRRLLASDVAVVYLTEDVPLDGVFVAIEEGPDAGEVGPDDDQPSPPPEPDEDASDDEQPPGPPALLVGSTPGLLSAVPEGLEDRVLFEVSARLDLVLDAVLNRFGASWGPVAIDIGFAEGGLVLTPGVTDLFAEVTELIDDLRAAIEAGEIVVLPPPEG